jgi:hypothetical protein
LPSLADQIVAVGVGVIDHPVDDLFYDGRGTVRFLTNESGQVTDTYVYDAFGTMITATGSTNNRTYTPAISSTRISDSTTFAPAS